MVSLNSRTFSIAITAWSAKVCSRLMSAVGERLHLRRSRRDHADRPRPRASSAPPAPCGSRAAPAARARRGTRCRSAERRPRHAISLRSRNARPADRRARAAAARLRPPSVGRRSSPSRAACSPGATARRGCRRPGRAAARARRSASKHRLHVGRRAADDAQHLGGRRLPLERLLGLVEQAHVLDRDHRLVGEGLEQRDLLVGERPHLAGASTTIAPIDRACRAASARRARAVAAEPLRARACR